MPVGRVLIVGNYVDELAAANSVNDDRAVRTEPKTLVRIEPSRRQLADRDDAAVADLPGELRRVGTKEIRANHRMNSVRAHDNVGLDLSAIGEARRSA